MSGIHLVKVMCPKCKDTWLTTYRGRVGCVRTNRTCTAMFNVEDNIVPEPELEAKPKCG